MIIKTNFGIIIFLLIKFLSSCTDVKFNSEEWRNWDIKKNDSHLRWDMVDDLIDNHQLIGKSKNEIIDLLGEPNDSPYNSKNQFFYDLGPCRRGIDFASLYIHFKNGKVSRVKENCH